MGHASSVAPPFFTEADLLERLTRGVAESEREVVFLVGSALSAPVGGAGAGVPTAEAIVQLIRARFESSPDQLKAFAEALLPQGGDRYRAAFRFLLARRGQAAVNEVVRECVWLARIPESDNKSRKYDLRNSSDEVCKSLDSDSSGWFLPPGIRAIGTLIATMPDHFGNVAVTTNFDPLIEVAVKSAGGIAYRTVLHSEGNPLQTTATGCRVVHLHGYWWGADTLHMPYQLRQPRPKLKQYLSGLLKNSLVVVSGYSGWDDVFMETLRDLALDDSATPEVIWTFFGDAEDKPVKDLSDGVARGRVCFYAGVDCNRFFPRLLDAWKSARKGTRAGSAVPIGDRVTGVADILPRLVGSDRPPFAEVWVGREAQLSQLRDIEATTVYITGIGGQGKSTLAARYFDDSSNNGKYARLLWKDCKEEDERFENHVLAALADLLPDESLVREISSMGPENAVEALAQALADRPSLIVFDNVDHLVDLEHRTLFGAPLQLANRLASLTSASRIVFTCRPSVTATSPHSAEIRLSGLSASEAQRLFAARQSKLPPADVIRLSESTGGHAFWLDLLAIQSSRSDRSTTIDALVSRAVVPSARLDATLAEVLASLTERSRLVLRAMAETIRPESAVRIAEYVDSQLNYNKFTKALKELTTLNLVVVKPVERSDDLLELHPLVRDFVRAKFPHAERVTFIDMILKAYATFRMRHIKEIADAPRLDVLLWWTQTAELDVAAGHYAHAFIALREVGGALTGSERPGEFSRVAGTLLASSEWPTRHKEYKGFDHVFHYHVKTLSDLGRYPDAAALLDVYEGTIEATDARYIGYCTLRSYLEWTRGGFEKAVEWGVRATSLKRDNNLDTEFDGDQVLALARRDAGEYESALHGFLEGADLAVVNDPEELDKKQSAEYYGNIGRCLQLMGQSDPAIVCLRKSALLFDLEGPRGKVINHGYLRQWLAEIFLRRGDACLARIFFEAARGKWRLTAPKRAEAISARMDDLASEFRNCDDVNPEECERAVRAWATRG